MPRSGIGGPSALIAGQQYFFWLQKDVVGEIFVNSAHRHRAAYGGDYCRPYFAVDAKLIERLTATKKPIKRYRPPETSISPRRGATPGGAATLLGFVLLGFAVLLARRRSRLRNIP